MRFAPAPGGGETWRGERRGRQGRGHEGEGRQTGCGWEQGCLRSGLSGDATRGVSGTGNEEIARSATARWSRRWRVLGPRLLC